MAQAFENVGADRRPGRLRWVHGASLSVEIGRAFLSDISGRGPAVQLVGLQRPAAAAGHYF